MQVFCVNNDCSIKPLRQQKTKIKKKKIKRKTAERKSITYNKKLTFRMAIYVHFIALLTMSMGSYVNI